MEDRSCAYARYWRNSLADAELGRGGLSKQDARTFSALDEWNELGVGCVDEKTVTALFAGEPEGTRSIEVAYRPVVYLSVLEHGQSRRDGRPEIVAPLLASATLTREGRLCPHAGTFVARDLLEPLAQGSYVIGAVADLDAFLTADEVPGVDVPGADDDQESAASALFDNQWADYQTACARLLSQVCSGWPEQDGSLRPAGYGYLAKKAGASGVSQHIVPLYDHMRRHKPAAPLFDRYASERVDPAEPGLPAHAGFAARLGHASDTYPLAPAQRDALAHLLGTRHGEILGINGPPGTGKTTMLLSVVASLWAKAALEGGEPPVVLAASTNNQAVTNIIDAFGKDFSVGSGPLAGRWLPEVTSFGAYFPARGKEAKAAEKYQTRAFFDKLESREYVTAAQEHYLKAAAAVLPEQAGSLQAVVDGLRARIQAEAATLAAMDSAWREVCQARAAVRDELGDDPETAQAERRRSVEAQDARWRAWQTLQEQWDDYLARESIFYALFAWLPPVADKRLRLARQFLKTIWPGEVGPPRGERIESIEGEFAQRVEQHAQALADLRRHAERGEQALRGRQRASAGWAAALAPMNPHDGAALDPQATDLAAADEHADRIVRFAIFQWATHYWEGRWLLDMQALLPELQSEKKKNGRAAMEKRWRRRMKLTPCIVSTFFMLPSELKVSRHDGSGFVDDYLYDFADLLVVDEAGQVLPEVAGASFALAKQALVIGDTLQIEPIWSIPARVDIGNLIGAGLLSGGDGVEEDYQRLADAGKTAARGSVMRIAQCASRWHQDPDLARGLFLYEHRRCFDEIVGYCNTLCYHGKLRPMRGDKPAAIARRERGADDGLPALGYLHIDGLCRQIAGGSRENALEAEVIAAWLAANRQTLEAGYGKPLDQIVGVVTPFGAQVGAIREACLSQNIRAGGESGELTVGTVHSLQGAERPLIIFSPVYSKHADGEFIDKNASMLNVAVSRAKNTFLVFGDMDVLDSVAATRPRGLLASMLLSGEANALEFEFHPRRDLAQRAGLSQLRDASEHDRFLHAVLSAAIREVHIVTPWLRLECVEQTGAMRAMAAAVQRGVQVRVYTDPGSNTCDRDAEIRQRKRHELRAAAEALRACGIEPVRVNKVHSKIVIGDDQVYCVGSFNWFSARRDEAGARHETSLVYRGPELAAEIQATKRSLVLRTHASA